MRHIPACSESLSSCYCFNKVLYLYISHSKNRIAGRTQDFQFCLFHVLAQLMNLAL